LALCFFFAFEAELARKLVEDGPPIIVRESSATSGTTPRTPRRLRSDESTVQTPWVDRRSHFSP
jgi:hypothetical protein